MRLSSKVLDQFLRLALIDFRQIYNESWLIERHGHGSPAQFRRDQMDKLPLAA